jgi:uncharacterized SAM-binding protein YcdF (DUF218 family)
MLAVRKIFIYICIFAVIYIMYILLSIVSYAYVNNIVTSDAAIVLGAGIDHDQPSPVFRERIRHGIALYKSGKVKILIFTGGLGKGESFTESEVARNYAIKNGIHSNDIYIERKSKVTYGNILEARKIMRRMNINSVLIVSDPLHMKRAMTMAQDLGINANASPTPTSMYKSWHTKLELLVSEAYYYIGHLLRRAFINA